MKIQRTRIQRNTSWQKGGLLVVYAGIGDRYRCDMIVDGGVVNLEDGNYTEVEIDEEVLRAHYKKGGACFLDHYIPPEHGKIWVEEFVYE